MRHRNRVLIPGLLGLIGAIGYFQLVPYLRYGLNAAHIEEMDPFRVRHGATLSVPNDHLFYAVPKDRIPILNHPAFVAAADAPGWLLDEMRVMGVEHAGVAKAYPVNILAYHELVNDEVGGKPYLVTF